ncbi:MAG: DUF1287 domain-containing protein [Firmicutes bacterium]|nr:DUF1287 domain-containing protein [Bacillota bacterium]
MKNKLIKKVIIIVIVVIAVVIAVPMALRRERSPLKRTFTNEDFGIETYVSSVDKDGDGIDDQTDILENVRAYTDTKPVYKSAYYNGGYPSDGYGTCVDVVGAGLKGAGYDLMELVNADIEEHPEAYDADAGDKNIDFRRVRNLKVYFERNAIVLTKDIKKREEWQGGDIVVFNKHIAVVSDTRNADGIPYIIHHYSRNQKSYEEDAIRSWGDVLGHYRVS